jgi:hypothetical protein
MRLALAALSIRGGFFALTVQRPIMGTLPKHRKTL